MPKSWAFESQRLMYPMANQMQMEGNRMVVGAVRGAVSEMSQAHLKQQAFDLQLMRHRQLQEAGAASLALQGQRLQVDQGSLAVRQASLDFEKRNADEKKRTRYDGTLLNHQAGEKFKMILDGNVMEYDTAEARLEGQRQFFPKRALEERGMAVKERHEGEYGRRTDIQEGRAEETKLSGRRRDATGALAQGETYRHHAEMEGIAKEATKLRDKFYEMGGTAGEFKRMFDTMDMVGKQREQFRKIDQDAEKALKELDEATFVEGYEAEWNDPEARYRGGRVDPKTGKRPLIYSKEVREGHAKKKQAILDKRDRETGALTRSYKEASKRK